MRKPALPLFSALLAAAVLCATVDAQRRRGRGLQRPELQALTFEQERFDSESLDRSVSYGVFLPKDYGEEANQDVRYPVVIWLHGMNEDHQRFWGRGGGAALDELTADGSIPKLIFVCPNGGRSSFYINAKGADSAVEDMVVQDLVDHVDETYRTKPGKHNRVIAGVSMGGYGALKIGLKHPDVFGICIAHSPAILPRSTDELESAFPWLHGRADRFLRPMFGNPVDEEMWEAENVLHIADRLKPDAIAGLRLYFDCAPTDRYGFHAPSVELHEALKKAEIPHTWKSIDDAPADGHGWPYTASVLPLSMQFVTAALAQKQGAAGLDGLIGGKGKTDKGGRKRDKMLR